MDKAQKELFHDDTKNVTTFQNHTHLYRRTVISNSLTHDIIILFTYIHVLPFDMFFFLFNPDMDKQWLGFSFCFGKTSYSNLDGM
jgi:TolB-like protein